jgi:Tol biopolymer transport system component
MPQKQAAPLLTRLDLAAWVIVGGIILFLLVVNNRLTEAVTTPTVGYLYPAYGGVQNVWFAPVEKPEEARQITFSEHGIYDFAASADGRYLAYSERIEPSGLHEIMLMNLQTRQVTQVTNCVAAQADCRSPMFRPTGGAIAYERVNTNTGVGSGIGVIRIWLADISRQPYDNQPLSQDSSFIGHSPRWARDGNSLAFYSSDIANPGILVYNFNPAEGQQTLKFVPSQYGVTGALSPNGQQLVYPDLSRRPDGQVYSFLRLADLAGLRYEDLTSPEDAVDDTDAMWNPDGETITIARRYTDERYTRGYQLYDLRVSDGQATPLLVDEAYSHGFFEPDKTGRLVVLQRFPLNADNPVSSSPQVWVIDRQSKALTLITDNAFHPRWIVGARLP